MYTPEIVKVNRNTLLFLAGLSSLTTGIFLFFLGMKFFLHVLREPALTESPALFSLSRVCSRFVASPTEAILCVIALALFLGYVKGRWAFVKAAKKQISRILGLPEQVSLKQLYSRSYYILMLLMVGLGMGMRFLPLSLDTRGAIDLIVGSGLLQSALLYGRTFTSQLLDKKRSAPSL